MSAAALWQQFTAFVEVYLNPIGVVIGIVVAVPIFWTWWDLTMGRRFRHRRWRRAASREPGLRPAILIVDLLPNKDVRTAVEHFRAGSDALRAIPEQQVFVVGRNAWLEPDDAPGLVRDIQAAAAEILRCGADVLHYFHAGPVFAAAVVGAEFANAGCRVLLYQNEQGTYVNFGPLRHPRF
jgi:hypothetical protein